MIATAQAAPAPRKQFRLSRYSYKANGFPQPKQQVTVRPSGGSRQTQPFDPSELSRRLEIYRQDQNLVRARREIAELSRKNTDETTPSSHGRNDSGHNSEHKTESGSGEEDESGEQEVILEIERPRSAKVPKPESIKLPSRPRQDRRISSSRGKRGPPGPFVPRFAAKQFSATTTPLPTKSSKQTDRKSEFDSACAFKAKHNFTDDLHMQKPTERVAGNNPDLAGFKDRRRSDIHFPQSGKSTTKSPRGASVAASRPRPLSTALENLNILDDDEDDINPYIPSSQQKTNRSRHDQAGFETYLQRDQHRPDPHNRPVIKYHDHQNDWSQASQYGDSARNSLHLHNIWRKDHSGDAEKATQSSSDAKQRARKQSDESGSQTMIADAAKQVNNERRRSSIMNFLKRHH